MAGQFDKKADLVVRVLNRTKQTGIASIGPIAVKCGVGRSGLTYFKREGDGATPVGRWRVCRLLYRPDRMSGFHAGALAGGKPLGEHDGWCDTTGDPNYNRPVTHPYPKSAEVMWRDDHLYDVVVVLDHNQRPRVQGGGSAIFMHLAREGQDGSILPTAGCVSLKRRDLAVVLRLLRPGSGVRIVG